MTNLKYKCSYVPTLSSSANISSFVIVIVDRLGIGLYRTTSGLDYDGVNVGDVPKYTLHYTAAGQVKVISDFQSAYVNLYELECVPVVT